MQEHTSKILDLLRCLDEVNVKEFNSINITIDLLQVEGYCLKKKAVANSANFITNYL